MGFAFAVLALVVLSAKALHTVDERARAAAARAARAERKAKEAADAAFYAIHAHANPIVRAEIAEIYWRVKGRGKRPPVLSDCACSRSETKDCAELHGSVWWRLKGGLCACGCQPCIRIEREETCESN